MTLVIRAATVDDIPRLVDIRLPALLEAEIRGFTVPVFATFSSTEALRTAWDRGNRLNDGFMVFVAEDEGTVVTFIVFQVGRDYGCIDNIVVANENQGKWIGRALVEYAEEMAKSAGCSKMKTDTTENADDVP